MSSKHDPTSPQSRADIQRAYDAITTAMRRARTSDRGSSILATIAALQAAMHTECIAAVAAGLPRDVLSSFVEFGGQIGMQAVDDELDGQPMPKRHDVQ